MPLNQPGSWDAFISYTQQDLKSAVLGPQLYEDLTKAGYTVWLDKKMENQEVNAMQEGVFGCKVFISIASEAYFGRDLCLEEVKWANQAKKNVIVCAHSTTMGSIGNMINAAPPALKFLFDQQVLQLNDTAPAWWKTSIDEIVKKMTAFGALPLAASAAVVNASSEAIGQVASSLADKFDGQMTDSSVPSEVCEQAYKLLQTETLENYVKAAKMCTWLIEFYAMNSIHKDQLTNMKQIIDGKNPKITQNVACRMDLSRFSMCAMRPGKIAMYR